MLCGKTNWTPTPAALVAIAIGISWLIYGAFFASTGLFTDDEIIYTAMIDRFATSGSLVIENGYEVNQAESLRLVTLRPGPHGLVPQYPAGYAMIAAPFYLIGGMQGIIFLNALASVFSLWLTYSIARRLFDDERLAINAALVFGLATFAADYAFAIWPHAVSNAFVALAIYASVRSVHDRSGSWRWAALAGLVLGLGATVRVETLIAAPFLLAWIFVNVERRPLKTLLAFSLTLAGGLCVAAYLNFLKFGIFNPVYYGIRADQGSNLALASYVQYASLGLLGLLAFMAFRWRRLQKIATSRVGWLLLAGSLAVVVLIPSLRDLAFKLANGLYALVIDLRTLDEIDTHPRIESVDGRYYLYYGILKKSLLESLPYLGAAILALTAVFKSSRRSAYFFCFFLPLAWFLPTAASEWIGGRANNLRYLSAMLPLIAILGAIAWKQITDNFRMSVIWPALGGLATAGLLLFLSSQGDSNLAWHQAFFITGWAQWFGLAVLLLCLGWAVLGNGRNLLKWPVAVALQTSFLLAFVGAYASDAAFTRDVRIAVEKKAELYSFIEQNAHVFSFGHFAFYFQLPRPEATLAFYVQSDIEADLEFMDFALRTGRPVYIASAGLARLVRRALETKGYAYGSEGLVIERALSPQDGSDIDLYKLRRSH